MALTSLGFYYPAAGDPPDVPGSIYQLALSLDNDVKSRQDTLSGILSGNAPGIVSNIYNGTTSLIGVNLQATNYAYRYLLWVSHSPFNASAGQVTPQAGSPHVLDNTAGYGPVTAWTIQNGKLFATVGGAGSAQITFASRIIKAAL